MKDNTGKERLAAGKTISDGDLSKMDYYVEGADDAAPAFVEDVGVDHGGGHVAVAEQFLHGADVIAGFEQVGGEAVAQRVRVRRLVDPGAPRGLFDVALDGLFVDVVAADHAAARVGAVAGGGKDVLPAPFAAGVRIFTLQGMRQFHVGHAGGQILVVPAAPLGEVRAQIRHDAGRQHCHAILVTLAAADGDLVALEIDIFDAQAQAFHEPHAGAVEQAHHQPRRAARGGQQALRFALGEHHRQALGRLGVRDAVEPGQVDAEHLACRGTAWRAWPGSACRRTRAPSVASERKASTSAAPMSWRVALAMKIDEAPDPVHVGVLRAQAVVPGPQLLPQPVQQPGRRGQPPGPPSACQRSA